MNPAARPRSTLLVALAAFVAALLPLAAVAGYFYYRQHQLIGEVDVLERQLIELNQRLEPIGDLDRLRGEMLARKQIVDVLQRPQRGLPAAVLLGTQLPAGVDLIGLDVDDKRLSLQARSADAAATAALLKQIGDVGFSDAAIVSRAADGTAERLTLEARPDPARLAAAAAAREVTP